MNETFYTLIYANLFSHILRLKLSALNIFNSPNKSFNLLLITGLVLITCNSGQKRFKISHKVIRRTCLYHNFCFYHIQSTQHIFSFHQVLLKSIKRFSNFSKIFSSPSLKYNAFLLDLKHSLNFMTTIRFLTNLDF